MVRMCGILLLSLVLTLSSAACGNNDKGATVKQNNIKTNAFPSMNKKDSESISKEVKKVKGVKKATVVIHNRDAIIGLDVKNAKDKKTIEQKVKSNVQKAKPNYTVHVTTDPKFHKRLQRIHTDMTPLDGHPVHNFSRDVGVLIDDITSRSTKR